jgi:hypothetical protein
VAEIPLPISAAFSSSEFDADGGGGIAWVLYPQRAESAHERSLIDPNNPNGNGGIARCFRLQWRGILLAGERAVFSRLSLAVANPSVR